MEAFGEWEVVRKIDGGGQGMVYEVTKKKLGSPEMDFLSALDGCTKAIQTGQERRDGAEKIINLIRSLSTESSRPRFALKKLHRRDNEADDEKALGRLRKELEALSKIGLHPALVRVEDAKVDERWFVMDFYPGLLSKTLQRTQGDLLGSLIILRPVVDAVAKVHEKGFVHRDIKPQNIFIAADGHLVLGDFGLVIDGDQSGRLTDTYENVGTRDWMPGWASGMRLEDVRPSFDVFSLGKVLWNLISGKEKLQLWYHRKAQFNLENLFPEIPMMTEVNLLLDESVVEEENDCLPNAVEFLKRIDSLIHRVKLGGQVLADGKIECIICRSAHYMEQPAGNYEKYLLCPFCGNVQKFDLERKPVGWRALSNPFHR